MSVQVIGTSLLFCFHLQSASACTESLPEACPSPMSLERPGNTGSQITFPPVTFTRVTNFWNLLSFQFYSDMVPSFGIFHETPISNEHVVPWNSGSQTLLLQSFFILKKTIGGLP